MIGKDAFQTFVTHMFIGIDNDCSNRVLDAVVVS